MLSQKRTEVPSGRLTRLIKYTTGEAKDLIKHCVQHFEGYSNWAKISYVNVRYKCYDRCYHLGAHYWELDISMVVSIYGDPLRVLANYRKEIRRWPTIKAVDASSFRSFHNFLLKFQSVTSNQTWNALDSPDTLCLMIAKFPRGIRDRWNRQVLAIRKRRSREPTDLIAFVNEETLLVDVPLFSNNAVEQYLDWTDKSSKRGSTKYIVKVLY